MICLFLFFSVLFGSRSSMTRYIFVQFVGFSTDGDHKNGYDAFLH